MFSWGNMRCIYCVSTWLKVLPLSALFLVKISKKKWGTLPKRKVVYKEACNVCLNSCRLGQPNNELQVTVLSHVLVGLLHHKTLFTTVALMFLSNSQIITRKGLHEQQLFQYSRYKVKKKHVGNHQGLNISIYCI